MDDIHCAESFDCIDGRRPDCHGILIPGRRGRLFSVLYTAGGKGPHPAVLLLHGIPGCEKNMDLAQYLRRAGFHVLVFHYSGSWGSDGEYSLSNDLEDANTALDFLLSDELYGIDKTQLYAVGHSLGGFVCAQLSARRPEIRAAVLLMPCDIGRISTIAAEAPEQFQTIRAVFEESAQWLNGTSGEALMTEAVINSEEYRLESCAEALSRKAVLCVSGTMDRYTPRALHCLPLEQAVKAAGGEKFQSIEYPTDHFFSDSRMTVAEAAANFLMAH